MLQIRIDPNEKSEVLALSTEIYVKKEISYSVKILIEKSLNRQKEVHNCCFSFFQNALLPVYVL